MAVAAIVVAVLLVLALLVAVAVLLRDRVRRWLADELMELAGPAIVAALPPRVVLSTLLAKIYGAGSGYESVLVGVLGGAGDDPDGRDLAVSRRTTAHFRMRAISLSTCSVVATWTHRLSGPVDDHNFVVFATCDAETWNLTSRGRLLPLYESWFVPDEDLFEDILPNLRESLEVGISYTDDAGNSHEVAPRRIGSTEVALRDYSRYVRLPDEVDRKNLQILQFDLGELFDENHVVGAIQGFSLRSAATISIGDGFLTWSPPYPCYVERITFDVTELVIDQDNLVFRVMAFVMTARLPITRDWAAATEIPDLELHSWLLPGHGVALLWKPADQVSSDADIWK